MKIEDFSTKEDLMCGLLVSINNRLTLIYDLLLSYIDASSTPEFMENLEVSAVNQVKARVETDKLNPYSFVSDPALEEEEKDGIS